MVFGGSSGSSGSCRSSSSSRSRSSQSKQEPVVADKFAGVLVDALLPAGLSAFVLILSVHVL